MVLASALALVLAAGCGGSKKANDEEPATAPATATAPPTATATATPTGTAGTSKPKVRVPKGKPPRKLVIEDLREGSGPAAEPGHTITVQYVGVSWSTRKQFDASWDRGQPFSFHLGAGQVIPGWDKGVAGMRVGGRRELIIPPRLGYGAQGSPPEIAPNETLVFVIDLLGVR
jgi:peptidylprolyl isomerase